MFTYSNYTVVCVGACIATSLGATAGPTSSSRTSTPRVMLCVQAFHTRVGDMSIYLRGRQITVS